LSGHASLKQNMGTNHSGDGDENGGPHLRTIFQLLHKRKNIDFSHYKMNTILRRIRRKMAMLKRKSLKQYAGFLLLNDHEAELLYRDLLINVTTFFRDSDAFLLLKSTVLPRLLRNKKQGETLRIWVVACATGEEVNSIAIIRKEIQEATGSKIPFQIFASDLSSGAINDARAGEYSLRQLKNVSPERLQLYFTKSDDKHRISRTIRDCCVFAQHNILKDPPFSHIGFISCRNLGFEATAFIRDKMNSLIPIIALTADVTTMHVQKCIAVGMNDYISKPIDEKLLFDKITGL